MDPAVTWKDGGSLMLEQIVRQGYSVVTVLCVADEIEWLAFHEFGCQCGGPAKNTYSQNYTEERLQ